MLGNSSAPGIIHFSVDQIFKSIAESPNRSFTLQASVAEIYLEKAYDLLDANKKECKIREIKEGDFVFDGQTKIVSMETPEKILCSFEEANGNRQTSATERNQQSSRSHAIFQITIESLSQNGDDPKVSTLSLVDLAGSERAINSKDSSFIKTSLLALGQLGCEAR